jgi:hypothetical protein
MSYSLDRQQFLEATADECWQHHEYELPIIGKEGEALYTDVAILHPNAKKILIVISGTHGLEAPAGTEVLVRVAQTFKKTDGFVDNQAIGCVLIHSLNPWGHSWQRRADQNNVDPNRGAGPRYLTRCNYASVHDIVFPAKLTESALEEIRKRLRATRTELIAFREAVTGGQHDFPQGLFYGGKEKCWAARTLEKICIGHLRYAEQVGLADLHTGIGERGKITKISPLLNFEADARNLSRKIFATKVLEDRVQFVSDHDPNHTFGEVTGDLLHCTMRALPTSAVVVPIGIEIGTTPMITSLPNLVAENWYWQHASTFQHLRCRPEPLLEALRQDFAPLNDEVWRHNLVDGMIAVIRQLYNWLEN